MGLFSSIIGVGGDLIASYLNNKNAQEQGRESRRENYEYGEMAAENADMRTRNLYNDFYSPKALLAQLKDAGLSPALMYDGASGGGATPSGAMGTGASGIQNQVFGMDPIKGAQLGLLEAQTNKLNAETKSIKGETTPAMANVKLTLSQANLNNALTAFNETQNSLSKIDTESRRDLNNQNLKLLTHEAERAYHESKYALYNAENEKINWELNKETYNEQVQLIKKDLALKTIQYLEADSKIKLNDEQRAKLIAETEEIYNNLYHYSDTTLETARDYQDWLEKQTENLPKQLELTAQGLTLQNKQMWLNFAGDMARTAGNTLGLILIGKGSKSPAGRIGNPVIQPYNANGPSGANAWGSQRHTNWWDY